MGAPRGPGHPHKSSSSPCIPTGSENPKPTANSLKMSPGACIPVLQVSSGVTQPLPLPLRRATARPCIFLLQLHQGGSKVPGPWFRSQSQASTSASGNPGGTEAHAAGWWLPGTQSSVLRPRPTPLPANKQTPVVEDGHGDDGQPVIVHVVGGVHHGGVLLLSGNTDTQAAQCAGRPQLWKGFETWPSLRDPRTTAGFS